MSTGTQTITADNLGPIDHLDALLPPEGGVTVLRGPNGSGKSIALDAISRTLGGTQSPNKSDGAAKGIVEAFGVKLTLGKVSRTSGQCVAVSLEGKLDVGAFIDPGIADPEAADRKRIKALLAIRGVGADAERFRDLAADPATLGVVLESHDVANASDLVEQARRVKAQLEEVARVAEKDAATLDGQAFACREVAEGVDLKGESDGDKLQTALEVSLNTSSALAQQQTVCTAADKARKAAQESLDNAKDDYIGPAHDEARRAVAALTAACDARNSRVKELTDELQRADDDLTETIHEREQAVITADLALHHENIITGWQATIDADHPEPVGAADYAAAELAVREARAAIERGALIRDAITKAVEAGQHHEAADHAREDAEQLRGAAKATDDVLSAAVASDTIRVENGRLVVPHGKRGKCLVGDLSRGECARLGILEAVAAIRAMHAEGVAVIVVPQHIWEGLDPAARQLVCEVAREEKVNIVTAMADNGPLRVETEGGDHVVE